MREHRCRCRSRRPARVISPVTVVIGASSTFASVTRDGLHGEAFGERPAGVVVRASSADRSGSSTGSRAARRRCASTAGPCGRCSCRPGTRCVSGGAARRCRSAASPACRAPPRPPRPPRPAPAATLHRHRDGERRRRARDLHVLLLQHAQQIGLRAEARIVRRAARTRPAPRSSPSGSSACSSRRSC